MDGCIVFQCAILKGCYFDGMVPKPEPKPQRFRTIRIVAFRNSVLVSE